MPFRELLNKLLPVRNREETRSRTEPDSHSTKSASKSSSSFFSTPPPSYEEATSTSINLNIPSGSMTSTSMVNTRRSFPRQLSDANVGPPRPESPDKPQDRIYLHLSYMGPGGVLFLSKKESEALLFVYYLLVDYGLELITSPYKYIQLPHTQPELRNRAATNVIGNYAFMLALLHCSKRYNIAGGRLALSVNRAVCAIRRDVKNQMVEDLVGDDGRYEESRHKIERVVDVVADRIDGLEYAFKLLDDGFLGTFRETAEKTRDSIDTGELDGEKVQECWSLFTAALEYRTTTGDLLPPPGFCRFSDSSQATMRGIWR